MSLFTNALAGIGEAAASLSNRYIDDEILRNRQQAFLDMQRRNTQQTRADEDAFRNDPERIARDRTNKVIDTTSVGDAQNDVRLRGMRNEASDQTITAGQAERERAMAQARGDVAVDVAGRTATKQADVARDEAKKNAGDPLYLKSVTAIKLADPQVAASIAASKAAANASNAQAGYTNTHAESLRMDINDKKRLDKLYTQASTILSDSNLSDEDRAAQMSDVNKQIALIKAKNGTGAARDPELDTVTTEEKTVDPATGKETKTTRKETRRPGQSSGADAPYPDGTELKGKDGKVYVVTNGQPVLKQAAPAPARASQATAEQSDVMRGITFAGDGYSVNGVTYPTLLQAKMARDKPKPSEMSSTMDRYGD
jgi:hypothetical protein